MNNCKCISKINKTIPVHSLTNYVIRDISFILNYQDFWNPFVSKYSRFSAIISESNVQSPEFSVLVEKSLCKNLPRRSLWKSVHGYVKKKMINAAEAYPEPCQTYKKACFSKIVNCEKLIILSQKCFTLNVWQCSEYASAFLSGWNYLLSLFLLLFLAFWTKNNKFSKIRSITDFLHLVLTETCF